jgi:hypothetical protein
LDGPIEGAEKGPRRHGRLGAAAALFGDERPHTALVAIAFGDDPLSEAWRQGIDLEMRSGAFHFIDQAEDVGEREVSDAGGEGSSIFSGESQRRKQAIQGLVLAEEEQLLLAAEVVVQVPMRQVGGDRDVAHPGGGEAAGPKDARGGAHDLHTTGVRAFRTTVRRMNHGSSLSESSRKETVWGHTDLGRGAAAGL